MDYKTFFVFVLAWVKEVQANYVRPAFFAPEEVPYMQTAIKINKYRILRKKYTVPLPQKREFPCQKVPCYERVSKYRVTFKSENPRITKRTGSLASKAE